MNRIAILLTIVIATSRILAQSVDSIPHHHIGPHSAQGETLMELCDGDILNGILLCDLHPSPVGRGYVLHKVHRPEQHGGTLLDISDTLFMEYELLPWHLTVKDPHGKGNVLAEIANDGDNGCCYLRIRHFNDDLAFDTVDIVVPLGDFLCTAGEPGLLLDPNGDLIGSYYDYYSSKRNFIRVGLDGTIKHQTEIDPMNIDAGGDKGPIVFSESPLRYGYWGTYYNASQMRDYVNFYLLDSLFNVTKCYALQRQSGSPDNVDYSNDGFVTVFLGLEDGQFLTARPYNRSSGLSPYIEDDGVAVMKCDSSFNVLARRKFLSEPYLQYFPYGAKPIGIEKSKDGNIYFAYLTNTSGLYYGHYYGRVSVVKMDPDLNIIWQRYCLEPEGYDRGRFGKMIVLEDNSVAVTGINTISTGGGFVDYTETFCVIVNDDYDNIQEYQGIVIRPYTYWPNPVKDELHLQYSPDVQPKIIELFDLQGHLVRTQNEGLEALAMHGLAAGQYLMKVTLKDGKVFTDKVVKE